MATLGSDGDVYLKRLEEQGIRSEFVRTIADAYTAQAMIITDTDNNQINGFHPGAMEQAWQNRITPRDDIKLGIIAPDGRDAMCAACRAVRRCRASRSSLIRVSNCPVSTAPNCATS